MARLAAVVAWLAGAAVSVALGAGCEREPCLHGAACVDQSAGTYRCYCPPGYTGDHCQTDRDDCRSSPCLHNGTCFDLLAGFRCKCVQGYGGERCEDDLDECLSSPCQNGGACLDHVNGFSCSCPPGYLGKLCEEDLKVCEDNPCENGGTCVDGPGTNFTCKCLRGFHGIRCEVGEDACYPSPCQNGGTCVLVRGTAACVCDSSHTGEQCEIQLLPCEPNPCDHGGLCVHLPGQKPTCYCVPDFYGPQCQYQYDDCARPISPCQNGGTCVDGLDTFSCHCPLHYTGPLCEVPCFPLGCNETFEEIEVSSSTSLTMEQPTDREGATAVAPWQDDGSPGSNECSGIACRNGGFLRKISSGECTCVCPEDWEGPYCEKIKFRGALFGLTSSIFLPLEPNFEGFDLELRLQLASVFRGSIISISQGLNFILLEINQGYFKLNFSCGNQTTLFEDSTRREAGSNVTVSLLATWLPASDEGGLGGICTIALAISESSPLSAQLFTKGNLPPSNLVSLYLGRRTPSFPPMESFLGCLYTLRVNGNPIDVLTSTSIKASNVKECIGCPEELCLNGGTCKRNQRGRSQCICKEGFSGPHCAHSHCSCPGGEACIFTREGFICQEGAGTNSPSLDPVTFSPRRIALERNIDVQAHVEVKFFFFSRRLEEDIRSSLLFMMGQPVGSPLSDFWVITLQDGFATTSINLGSGIRELKSPQSLAGSNDTTHFVYAGRYRRYMWLQVDHQRRVLGTTPGVMHALNVGHFIFLGGWKAGSVSPTQEIMSLAPFSGCIFGLKIRTSPWLEFTPLKLPAQDSSIAQNCAQRVTCHDIICQNGGSCQEEGKEGPRCKCKARWKGLFCEEQDRTCRNGNKCARGSECEMDGEGYLCHCPLGKTGKFCDKARAINTPHFDGISSYLALRSDKGWPGDDIYLIIEFASLSAEGLLAHFSGVPPGDFLTLSLAESHLKVTLDLGIGRPVELKSQNPLALGSWHRAEFTRRGPQLQLQVDGEEATVGKLIPGMTSLDVAPEVVLGGLPSSSSFKHLHGCVRHFEVNREKFDLSDRGGGRGRDIEECGLEKSCALALSCHHGGSCHQRGDIVFCHCPKNFSGRWCENKQPCDICRNEGQCWWSQEPNCLCPLTWTGPTCEKEVRRGSGLFLRRSSFIQGNVWPETLSFEFSSSALDGTLVWLYDSTQDSCNSSTFLTIEASSGKVAVRRSHQSWSFPHLWDASLAFHLLNITTFPNGTVEVDLDGFVLTSNGTSRRQNGSVLIGTSPCSGPGNDNEGRERRDFTGCVRNLKINGLDVTEHSLTNFLAYNVEECRPSTPLGILPSEKHN